MSGPPLHRSVGSTDDDDDDYSSAHSFAPPGKEHSTNENISLVMKFFLGMHDLLHVPVPIWVAVESVVGTVRLRCQMVSKPPYIRNVTFTLMGVPAISAVSFSPTHPFEETFFVGILTLVFIV